MFFYAPSNTANAAINPEINFQGKLVNPDGTNVADGNYSIVFSIYNVATGGTAIWTETQTVAVSSGIFQVNLGSVTSLPGSIDFNSGNIYLGIKVGSDAEMSPRIQFTSVPQAFDSSELNGLTSSQFARTDANNTLSGTQDVQNTSTSAFVIQQASAGAVLFQADTTNQKVGIGSAPTVGGSTLQVSGTVSISTLGSASGSSYLCYNSSNQIAGCSTTGNGAAFVQGGNSFGVQAVLGTNDANNLEIGTYNGTVLQQRILISNTTAAGNNATLTFDGTSVFKPTTDSTTAFQVQPAGSSSAVFNVDTTNGRVGIGTNAPADVLDIHVNNSQYGMRITDNSTGNGIQIQGQFPSINFNNYFDGTNHVAIGNGYTGAIDLNPNSGDLELLVGGKPGSGSVTSLSIPMHITTTGQAIFKNVSNSTAAFEVQPAGSSSPIFNVDSSNAIVSVEGGQSSSTIGSELMSSTTNFTTGWSGANWTFNATSAVHTAGATTPAVYSTFTPTAGTTYQVTFTFSGASGNGTDTVTPNIGGSNGSVIYAASDTNETELITAVNTNKLEFIPSSSWNGSITSVSVKTVGSTNAALKVINTSGSTNLEVRASSNTSNSFVGLASGQFNNSGINDTALGQLALTSNVSGTSDTGLGSFALKTNSTGNNNTGIGYEALYSNTSASNNTAVGSLALFTNTTGSSDVAVGTNALQGNMTGSNNSAFGYEALQNNTTGGNNTAMGQLALQSNTTGGSNVAIGSDVLAANTTGSSNVAIGGVWALLNNTTGSNNISLGNVSLLSNTTGGNNVAIGTGAGYTNTSANANTTGSSNTFIGYESGPGTATQLQNASSIGTYSVVDQSDSLVLGCISGVNGCTATTKVGIGTATPGYTLDVAGNINTNAAYMLNGTDINTAGTLNNVAYLNQGTTASPQTFTGVNKFTGSGNGTVAGTSFENTTDSTTALEVLNHSGSAVATFDTSNSRLGIGTNSPDAALSIKSPGVVSVLDLYGVFGQQQDYSAIQSSSAGSVNNPSHRPLMIQPNGGSVGINTLGEYLPYSFVVDGNSYSTGTIRQDNGTPCTAGTMITGTGTTFTPNMTGGWIKYNDGSKATVTYVSPTQLTSSVSKCIAAGAWYTITYDGFNVTNNGTAFLQPTADSTSAFQVQSSSGTNVLSVDTSNQMLTVRNKIDSGTVGPELFTSSETFGAATGWGSISGTAQSATATHTAGGGTTAIAASPALSLANYSYYQITYTTSGTNASTNPTDDVTAYIGGSVYDVPVYGNQTDTEVIYTSSHGGNLTFVPTNNWAGTITSVSVKLMSSNTTPLQLLDSSGNDALEVRTNASNSGDIGVGAGSLEFNTTGYENAALGGIALQQNTTGYENTAVGYGSLTANTTGTTNTAVGTWALTSNTIGQLNTAVGEASLTASTTAIENSALGFQTLSSDTTGGGNTAVGYRTLAGNTVGGGNSAVGQWSLLNNTTGSYNSGLGEGALQSITTGSNNTAVGEYADVLFGNLQYATAIGGETTVGTSNTIALGRAGTDRVTIDSPYSQINQVFGAGDQIYSTGTITQSGTTITGSGTAFTSGMNGGTIVYSDGTTATVTYVSGTSLTSSMSKTISSGQSYHLVYAGFNMTTSSAGFQPAVDNTSAFYVQNASGAQVLNVDTTNRLVTVEGPTSDAALGAELNSGGSNFTSGWTCTNWTCANGSAAHVTGNTNALIYTAYTPVIGDTYQITYTFSGAPGNGTDSITPSIGGASGEADYDTSGTDTQVITISGTADLQFTPTSGWNGTITSVSLKPITVGKAALTVENSAGNSRLEVRTASIGADMFVGYDAGMNNTTGNWNDAFGFQTLQSNTTGSGNQAFGGYALGSNTTGGNNSAFGTSSLNRNTIGSDNVAYGANSLMYSTTGNKNSALGSHSMQYNLNGYENTAVGYNSLQSNTIGYLNTAVGSQTLVSNTTGYESAAIGDYALQGNTTGYYNVAMGSYALSTEGTNNNDTAIGTGALDMTTANSSTAVGAFALYNDTTGDSLTAVGSGALNKNTTGYDSVALGGSALYDNTTGNDNIGIGWGAGVTGTSANANTTGSNNIFIGEASGPGVASSYSLQNSVALGTFSVVNSSNTIALGCTNGVNTCTATPNVGIASGGYANNPLTVVASNSSAGTISQSGTTTVTGTGTSFSAAMVGGKIYYSDGTSDTIATYSSATSITTMNSHTESGNYTIVYGGFNIQSDGSVTLQNSTDSANAFTVKDASGTITAFNIDNSNNRHNVGIGAVASNSAKLYVQSGSYTLIQGDSTGSSNNLLDLQNNGTRVAFIGHTGSVAFQNSTDSTTAFQVQNAGGTSLFTIDTSGLKITLGPASSTPTLLVLGNKNTSGDPTEVDGAMYYNSVEGNFKCGIGGYWTSCAINDINSSYNFTDDFFGGGISNGAGAANVYGVGGLGWEELTTTSCNLNYNEGTTPSHDNPGVMHMNSGAVSGDGCALGQAGGYTGFKYSDILGPGDDFKENVGMELITQGRARFGFTNFSTTSYPATGNSGVWWEYDNGLDASHFRYCYANNSASASVTCASSTTAISATSMYHLEIRIISTTEVKFILIPDGGGTPEVHDLTGISVDLGGTNKLNLLTTVYSTSTSAQGVYVDYIQWTGVTNNTR